IGDGFHGNSIRLKTKEGAANLFSFDAVVTGEELRGEAELICFNPRAEAREANFVVTRSK
ncbi:MAG TPA: hypothetical protein PLB18_21105, partial [Acidobacteriota bacterium]|nr:hypothetical protein [Acidobacteriota bacterium]